MHAFTVEAMIGFIDSIQVLTSVGGGGGGNSQWRPGIHVPPPGNR